VANGASSGFALRQPLFCGFVEACCTGVQICRSVVRGGCAWLYLYLQSMVFYLIARPNREMGVSRETLWVLRLDIFSKTRPVAVAISIPLVPGVARTVMRTVEV
jgi:hypothetical protein